MSTEDGEKIPRTFITKPQPLTSGEADMASKAAETVANAASEGKDVSPNLKQYETASELGIVGSGAVKAIKENIAGRVATNEAARNRKRG